MTSSTARSPFWEKCSASIWMLAYDEPIGLPV
jgi:hypothetical protein